jgi:hypothetical protein
MCQSRFISQLVLSTLRLSLPPHRSPLDLLPATILRHPSNKPLPVFCRSLLLSRLRRWRVMAFPGWAQLSPELVPFFRTSSADSAVKLLPTLSATATYFFEFRSSTTKTFPNPSTLNCSCNTYKHVREILTSIVSKKRCSQKQRRLHNLNYHFTVLPYDSVHKKL